MWEIALESHNLDKFIAEKGGWSGEGEEGRRHEVIGVGALFINSCLPFVLTSGLLPSDDVIPHGREA